MIDQPTTFSIQTITPGAPISPSELPLPAAGPYFIAAKDGYFVHRTFHFGRVLVPISEAVGAPELNPTIWYNNLKLPNQLVGQALSFFRAIWEKQKTEAMVDITYHADHGYRLFVPPQECSMAGVEAKRNMEHYVGQIVGTIHSHCNFNAFHSGTDTHDADSHDGLHITIGHVDTTPDIALMIRVSGISWDLNFDEVFAEPLAAHPHPTWWERHVKEKTYTSWNNKSTSTTPKSTPTNGNKVIGYPMYKGSPSKDHPFTDLDNIIHPWREAFSRSDEIALQKGTDELQDAITHLAEIGIDVDVIFDWLPSYRQLAQNDLPFDAWPEFDDDDINQPIFDAKRLLPPAT